MKRHHINLGARTTADGVVTSASSLISINGVRIALEGDEISCHTCGGTGVIRCIGPRISERFNGRNVALENDLRMCNCPSPPRLLANQTHKCQHVDGTNTHWVAPQNRAEGNHGAGFDQRFLLLDSVTSIPLARQPYRLKHGNTIVEGISDEDGYTMPIPTGDSSATVEWTVLGEDPHG
jgi:uncharacterized Zn-binding protein involved in type VI secretion